MKEWVKKIMGLVYRKNGKFAIDKLKVNPAGCSEVFLIDNGYSSCGKVRCGLSISFPYHTLDRRKVYAGGVIANKDVILIFLWTFRHLIRLSVIIPFMTIYHLIGCGLGGFLKKSRWF